MRKIHILALTILGLFLLINSSLAQTEIKAVLEQQFNLNNGAQELNFLSEKTDELGMTHKLYNQTYQGVPIYGSEIVAHLDNNENIRTISGDVLQNYNVDVNPVLTEDQAISKARELWQEQFDLDKSKVIKSQLYIFNQHTVNKQLENKNYLVYLVQLYYKFPTHHEYYFIDAHDGSLVYQSTGIRNLNRQVYDCTYYSLYGCILDIDGGAGYIYGRSEGNIARGVHPYWGNEDTDDLYDILYYAHNYYYNTFGLNGANGLGGIGDGTNADYVDTDVYAYLDGWDSSVCPNAFWDGFSVNFCYGLVVTDIVAHEYGHGFLDFAVPDMPYESEVGAIHEAYADIFGEAVERYQNGTNDWIIGSDITLISLDTRDLSDPSNSSTSLGTLPTRFNDPNFYCASGDNYGVHQNSTVISHAAYLMAEGGTFNTCTITGVGDTKQQAIFHRAATTYITTASDFNSLYTALMASCNDLYDSTDCIEVDKALRSVELNQDGYCSGVAAVDPGCAALDAIPAVSSVSSDTADGAYKAGSTIDIDVNFSKPVTSTGDVTITLDTGYTCAFTVSGASTGTCDYVVTAGENSADLSVSTISGTIVDSYGDAIVDFTIPSNLNYNKAIVIDTVKPLAPRKLKIYSGPKKTRRIKTINPRTYSKVIKAEYTQPYFLWTRTGDELSGDKSYYIRFSYKNLKRSAVMKKKFKQTKKYKRGSVQLANSTKKYKLYMVVVDNAGNKSKLKTLATYKYDK